MNILTAAKAILALGHQCELMDWDKIIYLSDHVNDIELKHFLDEQWNMLADTNEVVEILSRMGEETSATFELLKGGGRASRCNGKVVVELQPPYTSMWTLTELVHQGEKIL